MSSGRLCRGSLAVVSAALYVAATAAPCIAEDPLEQYDPTSEWEQRQPFASERRVRNSRQQEKKLREEWTLLRQRWSMGRRMFLLERAEFKQQARQYSEGGHDAEYGPADAASATTIRQQQHAGQMRAEGESTLRPEVHTAPALHPLDKPRSATGNDEKESPGLRQRASSASSGAGRRPSADDEDARHEDANQPSEEQILEEIELRQKREQLELDRKAGLVEGQDGQIIDPELKEEMQKQR